jgi:hypothetical protein
MKRISKLFFAAVMILGCSALSLSAYAAGKPTSQVSALSPVYLQLEFTTSCTDQGTVINIVNHGEKWPQMGFLRLYMADDKSMLGERKLRLASGQKVSFVVKDEISNGHPIAVWIEPQWYQRDFKYDATVMCG